MTHDTERRRPTPAPFLTAAARSAAEVAALLDAAAAEDEALQLLDGGMTRLREVHQARAELAALSTDEIRTGLLLRHGRDPETGR
jgi:hypothetical protein